MSESVVSLRAHRLEAELATRIRKQYPDVAAAASHLAREAQTLALEVFADLEPGADRAELVRKLGQAQQEQHEHTASFRLRWDADMRAIKRWQAAHPGKELVWPDHADLVVWLLEQLESKEATTHG